MKNTHNSKSNCSSALFSFKGRISRSCWWKVKVISIIIVIISGFANLLVNLFTTDILIEQFGDLLILEYYMPRFDFIINVVVSIVSIVLLILIAIVWIFADFKRLQDSGLSKLYFLLTCIPVFSTGGNVAMVFLLPCFALINFGTVIVGDTFSFISATVSLIGWIVFFIMTGFLKGTDGDNKYGSDPLED